jgi:hypothetical protein
MGLNLKRDMRRNVPINFTREEMRYYMKHFRRIDVENKGFLTLSDLKRHLQVSDADYSLVFHVSRDTTSADCLQSVEQQTYTRISFQHLSLSGLVSVVFTLTETSHLCIVNLETNPGSPVVCVE